MSALTCDGTTVQEIAAAIIEHTKDPAHTQKPLLLNVSPFSTTLLQDVVIKNAVSDFLAKFLTSKIASSTTQGSGRAQNVVTAPVVAQALTKILEAA